MLTIASYNREYARQKSNWNPTETFKTGIMLSKSSPVSSYALFPSEGIQTLFTPGAGWCSVLMVASCPLHHVR